MNSLFAAQRQDMPILCLGEVLWDALPTGLFLGGAPFNVACHLRQLGIPVRFASRVGNDELGREIRHRMGERGIDADLLQVDEGLPTGFVRVALDARGGPAFTIHEPSAWDTIAPTDELVEAARRSQAVVYGSLAWRSRITRATILEALAVAPLAAIDVNLRPPFDQRATVLAATEAADVVKLSDSELDRFSEWLGLTGSVEARARALAKELELQALCVTAGAAGAMLLAEDRWLVAPGIPVDVADTVGAGDSFFAALLAGLVRGGDPAACLSHANAVAAFVASQPGATPALDHASIEALKISCS